MPLPEPLTVDDIAFRNFVGEIIGPEKIGKTHLGFTSPPPLLYVDLNNRCKGTIEKFVAAGVKIHHFKVDMTSVASTRSSMKEAWKLLRDVPAGKYDVRTTVIDTWSEFRTANVPFMFNTASTVSYKYADVNRALRELVDLYKDSGTYNLVLISEVRRLLRNVQVESAESTDSKKPQETETVWTGDFERKGLYDTGSIVNFSLQPEYDRETQKVRVRVENCGYDIFKNGMYFEDEQCQMPLVLAELIPGTTPSYWR